MKRRAPIPLLLRARLFCGALHRFGLFLRAALSRRGLGSPSGRALVRGKLRRAWLSRDPARARELQRRHGLGGGCAGCGASCNLLFRCPQWNEASRRCTIYEHRPGVCRLFPITPEDLRDRALAGAGGACGYAFAGKKAA